MSDSLLFINGRFYTDGHESHFAKCMLVVNGFITYIGDDIQHARALAADNNAIVHDLEEKYVLPGFIDGHAHTLLLGQKLQKLELEHCKNVEDVRSAIRAYAQTHSDLARIMCSGWMEHMTEGNVTTGMLDDLDPRPIFIDSRDLHSSWCNTPAMEEMEVYSLPDPVGGKIHRDADGVPTGLFSEAACVFLVWPHLAKVASPRDRIEAVRRAIHDMNASGLTGLIDMAMDEISWDALQQLRREEGGQLPVHVAAHWFIKPTDSTPDDLAQVDKAIELQRQFNQETSPELWITGIKLMCDGVIDSCTAALLEPYTTGHDSAPVIWSHDALGASVSSEEPLRTSQEATGEKSQSKAEEDEAGAAEGMGRSSSAVVAKQRALSEMHARLGGNIEDILVERIQPKEKVAEGEWRCKAPMRWRKGLLRALAKLVRLEVTTQEISDLLCARVDARQRQEKRSGPGNSAVRQTEVYEVMDRLKAMGRGMERVVAEDHDMEDIGEDSDEGDIVD
ncbi:hypothetical protein KC360_g8954 [Hortaea werneckii]|nr:hypothetical protein KC325_g8917 [Hortaea werneckii]KAI6986548.1 hypothetical protein KC359_g8696 [Hortaea werneckii]KAI7166919.1 hypothetical protein KC360_g8954 [Hortaea werneckii]